MDGLVLRPTFHINEEDDGTATTRLVLHGELDCSSAPQLRARIRDTLTGGTTTLILDLAGISFLGAAGLGVHSDRHHLHQHSVGPGGTKEGRAASKRA